MKYYLLIIANPLSNSKAAMAVFRAVSCLDILSKDVSIFLPGFHQTKQSVIDENRVSEQIKALENHNEAFNQDYHGKEPIYHSYCKSAGDMVFNDADFAMFMLDLEEKCPSFEYYGDTELLLLPTDNGIIHYDQIKAFDLEPFFNNTVVVKRSLDQFLITVIKLLIKNMKNQNDDVARQIDELHASSFEFHNPDSAENVVLRIDRLILELMKWKESEDIFFISYSTKDEIYAFGLKELLEKNGKQVWIAPDGIPSGTDYACAIPAALRISTRAIVVLSENSIDSQWVRKEVSCAINDNLRIDPVLVDGSSLQALQQNEAFKFLFENIQIKYNINDLFADEGVLHDFLR